MKKHTFKLQKTMKDQSLLLQESIQQQQQQQHEQEEECDDNNTNNMIQSITSPTTTTTTRLTDIMNDAEIDAAVTTTTTTSISSSLPVVAIAAIDTKNDDDNSNNNDNRAVVDNHDTTTTTTITSDPPMDGVVVGIPFGMNYYYSLTNQYQSSQEQQQKQYQQQQQQRRITTSNTRIETSSNTTNTSTGNQQQQQQQDCGNNNSSSVLLDHFQVDDNNQQKQQILPSTILPLPWNTNNDVHTVHDEQDVDPNRIATMQQQQQHQPISVTCSSQSTIIVSPIDGSIYQVGTMHGVIYKQWQLIDINYNCHNHSIQSSNNNNNNITTDNHYNTNGNTGKKNKSRRQCEQQQQRQGSIQAVVPIQQPYNSIRNTYQCCQVSAGRHYCLARINHGMMVVSWGAGHFGQLGVVITTTITKSTTATKNNNNNKIQQQSSATTTSQQHTGNNGAASDSSSDDDDDDDSSESETDNIQTSVKCISFTSKPVLIERLLPNVTGGSPIIDIAAGDWHALALTESGHVWSWGLNRSLQCGIPFQLSHKDDNNKPSSTSSTLGSLALPLPIPGIPPMKQIAAGRAHSCALTAGSGKVYCWGNAHLGQCGTGSTIRRSTKGILPTPVQGLPSSLEMVQITAAGNHCISLSKAGRVFTWGDGREGQLGFSITASTSKYTSLQDMYSNKPRLVADIDFVAIEASITMNHINRNTTNTSDTSSNSQSVVSESNMSSSAQLLARTPKIVSVYASDTGSAAISSCGHVYCWGSNDVKQLGVPTPDDIPQEEVIPDSDLTASVDDASKMRQSRSQLAGNRPVHIQTFDSDHNILLPVRVEAIDNYYIRSLAMGPNHMICFGSPRTTEESTMLIGRTLHEAQNGKVINVPLIKQKYAPYVTTSNKLYHPIPTRVSHNSFDTSQVQSIDNSVIRTISSVDDNLAVVVSPSSSPVHSTNPKLSNTENFTTIIDTYNGNMNGTSIKEEDNKIGGEQKQQQQAHRRRFSFGLFRSLRQNPGHQSSSTTKSNTRDGGSNTVASKYRRQRRRNTTSNNRLNNGGKNDMDNEPSIGTI